MRSSSSYATGIKRVAELANDLWRPPSQRGDQTIESLSVSRARQNADFGQHLRDNLPVAAISDAMKDDESDDKVPVWIFEPDRRTGLGQALRTRLGQGQASTKEKLLGEAEKLLKSEQVTSPAAFASAIGRAKAGAIERA